jgi:hypothetical protein
MKELTNFWSKLNPIQQVALVAIIVVIAWVAYQYFDAKAKEAKRIIRQKAEEQALKDKGVKPSYTESKYKGWAEQLYKAMDGPGTNTDVVLKIMSYQKNDADIMQLEKAFGLRRSSYAVAWLTDPTDLKDWLRSDLSETLMKQLNQQLSRQGISKRF